MIYRPFVDDWVIVKRGPLVGRRGRVTKASYADHRGDRLGADRVLVLFPHPRPTSYVLNRSELRPDTTATQRHHE